MCLKKSRWKVLERGEQGEDKPDKVYLSDSNCETKNDFFVLKWWVATGNSCWRSEPYMQRLSLVMTGFILIMWLHKEVITKVTVVVWDGEATSLHFGKKDELGSKSKCAKSKGYLGRWRQPDPKDIWWRRHDKSHNSVWVNEWMLQYMFSVWSLSWHCSCPLTFPSIRKRIAELHWTCSSYSMVCCITLNAILNAS
jgi:hypothetical protein